MAMGIPHGHFFWRTKRWPEQGPPTGINNGLAVAGWIHSALAAGEASAWLYRRYQALYQDDNEGLVLTKGGTVANRHETGQEHAGRDAPSSAREQ
jgi:hypothetical protein